jgi:hypothetical protein
MHTHIPWAHILLIMTGPALIALFFRKEKD